MRKRANLVKIFSIATLILLIFFVLGLVLFQTSDNLQTESVAVKPVSSQILASGSITSQNEAVLHFQTGGKLAYLGVKAGDNVYQGETIARLDTYALQQQLAEAVNNYKVQQDQLNQTLENQQAGVVSAQQRTNLDTTTSHNTDYPGTTEQTVVDNTVKSLIDQGQLNLQNASLNAQLANYAMQMASIQSPINGVVTSEDVTTPGVNVTPTTSFVIDDPKALVFRANVSQDDIDFVSVGSQATISIDGQNNREITGTVTKIYPQKMTLADGENVYQVDVFATNLPVTAKLGETGNVLIQSNTDANVMLVPYWVVLNHQYVWVVENGKAVLKKVTIGKTHGSQIEVTNGLSSDDKIINDPQTIAKMNYRVL